jgi:hypothetical protein
MTVVSTMVKEGFHWRSEVYEGRFEHGEFLE